MARSASATGVYQAGLRYITAGTLNIYLERLSLRIHPTRSRNLLTLEIIAMATAKIPRAETSLDGAVTQSADTSEQQMMRCGYKLIIAFRGNLSRSILGGFIYVGGRIYGMTAAHNLFSDLLASKPNPSAFFQEPKLDRSKPIFISNEGERERLRNPLISRQSTKDSDSGDESSEADQLSTNRTIPAESSGESGDILAYSFTPFGSGITLDEKPRPAPPGSDFALLGLPQGTVIGHNTYTSSTGPNKIESLIHDPDLKEGNVEIILGVDNVVEGYLLPNPSSLVIYGALFHTRKVQLQKPLGKHSIFICNSRVITNPFQLWVAREPGWSATAPSAVILSWCTTTNRTRT